MLRFLLIKWPIILVKTAILHPLLLHFKCVIVSLNRLSMPYVLTDYVLATGNILRLTQIVVSITIVRIICCINFLVCAKGWSTVCYCGISGSSSLFIINGTQRILHEYLCFIELIKRVEEKRSNARLVEHYISFSQRV